MSRPAILIVVLMVVLVAVAILLAVGAARRRGEVDATMETPTNRTGPLGQALRPLWKNGVADSTWDRLEEVLLGADVGVEATARIVRLVRRRTPSTAEEAVAALSSALLGEFMVGGRDLGLEGSPAVILVIGVNGSGKTTTIAKLAYRLSGEGMSVVLAAADTFRAAAGEQLSVWGDRIGVPVVKGMEGGDPASVVFDALSAARSKGADVVIVDTAGRLHSRKDLMAELAKVHRVAGGEAGVAEVLLVLDATGGQNGLAQVREFAATIPVTGLVLAKLDGTARGGIVVAVEGQLGVPVKLVGTGEGVDDLKPFGPEGFVASLLQE